MVFSLYKPIKKFLFYLEPETAHAVTLKSLWLAEKLRLTRFLPQPISAPVNIMGLSFPNRLGLAAGLDKNGEYVDALAALGFGFIEIGTVTPRPQAGNPLPRLFRLPAKEAIINRMGFNSKGVEYAVEQLKKTHYKGILGVNIGKNRDTPLIQAIQDYVYVLRCVIPYASYITINISSPNTENLRQLQHGELLTNLLSALKKEQADYAEHQKKYVPLVVKISPDLNESELAQMAEIFLAQKIDGVIATNTTISRTGVEGVDFADQAGGLSGKPLSVLSTEIIKKLSGLLKNQIPIIGCGGILGAEDAREKIHAGASLLQVYTGLIYNGIDLIHQILSNQE